MKRKLAGTWQKKERILAGPNECQQVCNWSNPEKTNRSCEGAKFSWLNSKVFWTNDRVEPAVDYRWTGWVWEITDWSSNCRKIADHLRGIHRICPNWVKENRRMWTCNRLDLPTLGSQPIMPQNLPDHCPEPCWWVQKKAWSRVKSRPRIVRG